MAPTPGDAPLLATKLFVPPPRENLVSRTRLRDRLSASRGGRVTLIAAAAGWGKSTLLADWAIEAPGRVAWLSLDPSDDDPPRFLNYVIAALRGAQGIADDDLLDVLSSRAEAIHATTTELLNAVAARGAPVSLVLDDYHSINARSVHDIVQFFIDHLPPNLHLAIATRSDPPLALSRLRASGMLLELRGDDLRFTADEAGAFLNGAMGLTLDPSDIGELEHRTEGWIVGLQMAALSINGRGGSRDFIQRFSGSNRFVLDYLTDEVLDRQSDEVRRFLLATSILTRLSPPLCDVVLQRSDSESILRQLDAGNLFLIPLDDVRYWYRYHHLFATLLQHQLQRTSNSSEVADLHRRASQWYSANRMPEPALEHALAANDVDRAIAIVAQHSLARNLVGDMASVVRWFAMLPQERIENDVNLLLSRAMAFLGDWQLPRAYESALKAQSLLTDQSPPGQRGAALGVRGTLERVLGNREEGNASLARAKELVEPESFWFSLVHYQIGMTKMMRAEVDGLIDDLALVRSRHSRPDQVMIAVFSQTFTAFAEWWRGNPERAIDLANETFRWIDTTEEIASSRPLDCFPNAVLAEVHCSWNDLEKARTFADRAVEHGRSGIMLGLFESARSLAHVAQAQRDWEAANRAATDLQRAIRNTGSSFYWNYAVEATVNGILFRRWQAVGNRADLHAVERWMSESGILEKLKTFEKRRYIGPYCDAPILVAARVLIENERYDEATDWLDNVWPGAVSTNRLLTQIDVMLLRSIIAARRGRVDEAVEIMDVALGRASAARYLRPFLDEGSTIVPIIERAAARTANRDFATRVLSSFAIPLKVSSVQKLPEGLSDREIEVLRLVASGASNQDAARKLFIAPSTVKKHLENIYSKLEVGGRTEAIARAHELKLLV